jgi:hypothetical protein
MRWSVEIRSPRRAGVAIVHRRRARLHNERPQFSKVLTPIVKIGEAIRDQSGADAGVKADLLAEVTIYALASRLSASWMEAIQR